MRQRQGGVAAWRGRSRYPPNHPKYLATRTRTKQHDKSSSLSTNSCMHVWDYNDFIPSSMPSQSPQHAIAKPVCSLGALSSSVETIVGIFGERLVYLENVSFWVSSIDITDPLEVPVRHFVIPKWLSLVNAFVLDVGTAGDIMFVKQSELAVIKRGLETTESGALFNLRRKGSKRGIYGPRGGRRRAGAYRRPACKDWAAGA